MMGGVACTLACCCEHRRAAPPLEELPGGFCGTASYLGVAPDNKMEELEAC